MLGVDVRSFDETGLLDWSNSVKTKTGEMGNYSIAKKDGMKFKKIEPTKKNPLGILTVEGSIHKYWNQGIHNANDFSSAGLSKTQFKSFLNRLISALNIAI